MKIQGYRRGRKKEKENGKGGRIFSESGFSRLDMEQTGTTQIVNLLVCVHILMTGTVGV